MRPLDNHKLELMILGHQKSLTATEWSHNAKRSSGLPSEADVFTVTVFPARRYLSFAEEFNADFLSIYKLSHVLKNYKPTFTYISMSLK